MRHAAQAVGFLCLFIAPWTFGAEIVPSRAAVGAHVIATGSNLDDPAVTVTFASGASRVPAAVRSRTSTLLEFVVPQGATSGEVRIVRGSVPVGAFSFTVTAQSALIKSATLVAASNSHDVLKEPTGPFVALPSGITYVADRGHHRIRAVLPSGAVQLAAGTGTPGFVNGAASTAQFREPRAVAIDAGRNRLYVADSGNHVIRVLTLDGMVSTFAGSGRREDQDGTGVAAGFNEPAGLAIDALGNLYVADSGNHLIRQISPAGVVTTLAGAGRPGLANGPSLQALFKAPEGIAMSASGVLYVADTGNHVLRRIENGVASTLAGTGHPGSVDGPGANAEFKEPVGLALDIAGQLLIVDSGNHQIRRFADGVVSTVAGSGKPGLVDGVLLGKVEYKQPTGIAVEGAVFIADTKNDAIRILYPQLILTDVFPRSGDPIGGTEVRIFGAGFVPGQTVVTFGSTVVAVTYVSSTELRVSAPAGSPGQSTITVTTPAGSASLSNVFEHIPPYVSLSISPLTPSLLPEEDVQLAAFGALSGGGAIDLTGQVLWRSQDGSVASIDASGLVHGLTPGSTTITATFTGLTATTVVTVNEPNTDPPVPPDPATVAPSLPETGGAALADGIAFLYSGFNPIQTGVLPGTIETARAAVIRGRVVGAANAPMVAAQITVAGHPEYGSTLSRIDGRFDLAVNGGQVLTIRVEKGGFLNADRQVTAPWQDFVVAPDIRLLAIDPNVTLVAGNVPAPQIARGSTVTDSSGTRRATALFFPGTSATMVMHDGTTQALTGLNVRATEYSVGAEGAQAMPAALPPQSAYTYCVEWSVDEAIAAGAKSVTFSQPVAVYVENFLGFATGTRVPSAFYDPSRRMWIPTPDGRVIHIMSLQSGAARVDTNGDGVIDDTGLTLLERQQLATLYPAGTKLWRVLVSHFSPYDFNFSVVAPGGSLPTGQATWYNGVENACEKAGSIIECENQTLGEEIGITGSPFALHYRSDRTFGRVAARTVDVQLTGATVAPAMTRIEVEIAIAGQLVRESFSPSPNRSYRFVWDGRDAYGRPVNGARPVTVRTSYFFPGEYEAPPNTAASFGRASGISLNVPARLEVKMTQTLTGTLGSWLASGERLGGWTVTPQHFYDAGSRTLYRGDGTRRTDAPEQFGALPTGAIRKVAGTFPADARPLWTGLGGAATSVRIDTEIEGMVVAPDGSVYVAFPNYLRKITPDGRLVHVAGNGGIPPFGFIAPTPAATAPLFAAGMSIAPDGSLYIAEPFRNRVRRIDHDGIMTTVVSAGLDFPKDVAVAPDGSIYICNTNANRVMRIAPDGVMDVVAGTGFPGSSGDGGPALAARLVQPQGLAIGPDGSLYILDDVAVRRVGPDGIITRVAGTGVSGYSGDGGLATAARVSLHIAKGSSVIAALPDGSIVFHDAGNRRIRRVDPNGIISTIAGTGEAGPITYGALARGTVLNHPPTVAAASDGSIYLVASDFEPTVGKIEATLLPSTVANASETMIADGALVYVLGPGGRHLRTLSADTGAALLTFGYTSNLVSTITDYDSNVLTVERDSNDNAKAIVAPGGQRTTLTQEPSGLSSITTAPGETTHFVYTTEGLMRTMSDPRSNTTGFTWDDLGLLRTDRDAEGGEQTLTRTQNGSGYTVEISTVGGRINRYQRTALPNADAARAATSPSGLTANTTFGADGRTVVTSSDGMRAETLAMSDPAWGMQSPFTQSATLNWPSGRVLSTTSTREATFASSSDPLTVATRTDRFTVNGKTTTRVFDRAALTDTVTTPMGRTLTARMNAAGRTERVEIAGILPTDMTYDARGRLATIVQGTRQQTFGYNAKNELTSIEDALSRTVRFEHDGAGRVVKQILPDLREILFGYDAAGNLTSLKPAGRPAHTFQYNGVNLARRYVPPLVAGTGGTEYIYSVDRELEEIVRPDGTSIDFGYDGGGRLETVTASDASRAFGFDAAGNLASTTGADVPLTYTYDGSTLTGMEWSGTVSGSVNWSFDDDARVSSESVVGDAVSFTYDDDGMLQTAGPLQLVRGADGLLDFTQLGGSTETFELDGHGELDELHHQDVHPISGVPRNLLTLDYTRDAGGRITGVVETVNGADVAIGYHYDPVGRLDQVSYPDATVNYAYDDNGNRASRTVTGPVFTTVETAAYDDQDRLIQYEGTQYTYTPNGDLLTKTDGSGTTSYTYDAFGNLVSVTLSSGVTIEYVIDGQNRRVGRKVSGVLSQRWLYSDQLRIIAELDATGAVAKRFVYGTRTNVPDFMIVAGVMYRIYSDHLGSPRLVVSVATGVVEQMLRFDEFGVVLLDTHPGFTPFGFAGGLYDPATAMLRFGARDYEARVGRWTAKDPILFGGGDASLYGYAFGDPINFIDSDGLSGTLTIHSDGKQGSSDTILAGHSWISYTPDGGTRTTFGTYGNHPNGGDNGLHEGLELSRPSQYGMGDASRTAWLDDVRERALMKLIDSYRTLGEKGWTSGRTCSSFASDAWYVSVGERLKASDGTYYPNPTVLRESILKANRNVPHVKIRLKEMFGPVNP